ncbi:CopD family protein [Pelagerythrobacter sp.]|uniref:CopD family protein n=1 Tax=Pelagerythrobacter sp. TaxID=2800702 RepID=UPI0035B49D94
MILTWMKALHLAALIVWCAGLIALPLLLRKHELVENQASYTRLRLITHNGYVRILTPAAVIAIGAGTALIWLAPAFEPWLFAKLVAVGVLVALHMLVGRVVILMSERSGRHTPMWFIPLEIATFATLAVILILVLAKPDIPDIFPAWLTEPQGHQLPVREIPI